MKKLSKVLLVLLCSMTLLSGCQKDKTEATPTPTPAGPGGTTNNARPIENIWILAKTIAADGTTTTYTTDTALIMRFKGDQTYTIFLDNGEIECNSWRTYTLQGTSLTLQALGACAQKDFDSVRLNGQINSPELNMRRIGGASNGKLFLFNKMSETDFNLLMQNKGITPPN